MAELPSLGEHCSHPECHQLDFLPIVCRGCQNVYCKDHFALEKHACTNQCDSTEKTVFTGVKSYGCDYQGCRNRELTPVVCPACEKNFCLSHRHQVEHGCAKYEAPQEKMTQTKEHVKNLLEAKNKETDNTKKTKKTVKGHKSKATAAKVALMKIKMNSLGDKGIPESERVYMKVTLPQGSNQRFLDVFVSSQWTVGKTIDYVAEMGCCDNKNNMSAAKKLRLFQSDSGECIDITVTVKQCIEGNIFFSGSTLILEYVDRDTNSLTNLDLYSS